MVDQLQWLAFLSIPWQPIKKMAQTERCSKRTGRPTRYCVLETFEVPLVQTRHPENESRATISRLIKREEVEKGKKE